MNTFKLQSELLKSAYARDDYHHKLFQFNYFMNDKFLAYTEGHYIYYIPFKEVYINTDKVFDRPMMTGLENFTKESFNNLQLTNSMEIIDKYICNVFIDEDNNPLFINENYLKPFILDECTFKGNSKKNILQVFEDDVLKAIILGVKKL